MSGRKRAHSFDSDQGNSEKRVKTTPATRRGPKYAVLQEDVLARLKAQYAFANIKIAVKTATEAAHEKAKHALERYFLSLSKTKKQKIHQKIDQQYGPVINPRVNQPYNTVTKAQHNLFFLRELFRDNGFEGHFEDFYAFPAKNDSSQVTYIRSPPLSKLDPDLGRQQTEEWLSRLPQDLKVCFEKQAWKDCPRATEVEHYWHLLSRIWDAFSDREEPFDKCYSYPSSNTVEQHQTVKQSKVTAVVLGTSTGRPGVGTRPVAATRSAPPAPKETSQSVVGKTASPIQGSTSENLPMNAKKYSGSSQITVNPGAEKIDSVTREQLNVKESTSHTAKVAPKSSAAQDLDSEELEAWSRLEFRVTLKNLDFFERPPADDTPSALGRILYENTDIMYHGSFKGVNGDVFYIFHCPTRYIDSMEERIKEFTRQCTLIHEAQAKGQLWPEQDLDLVGRRSRTEDSTRVKNLYFTSQSQPATQESEVVDQSAKYKFDRKETMITNPTAKDKKTEADNSAANEKRLGNGGGNITHPRAQEEKMNDEEVESKSPTIKEEDLVEVKTEILSPTMKKKELGGQETRDIAMAGEDQVDSQTIDDQAALIMDLFQSERSDD